MSPQEAYARFAPMQDGPYRDEPRAATRHAHAYRTQKLYLLVDWLYGLVVTRAEMRAALTRYAARGLSAEIASAVEACHPRWCVGINDVLYLEPGDELRQLGAHEHREHSAGEEEEDRRRDVLDPDHLVIGVDPEVVRPAASAVTRVIFGLRGLAEGPREPVVERAEPGEEADRGGRERRDGNDRVPEEQWIPPGKGADPDDDA